MSTQAAAILVAAGSSTRMRTGAGAGSARKPLLELAGRPLLEHACAPFTALETVIEIVVVAHPDDLDARAEMQTSACLAGMAIELSMLGGAHAMANPLTAAFDLPHGEAVGLFLPGIVRFNARDFEAARAYQQLAATAGLCVPDAEPEEAVRSEVRRYIVWPGQATSYKVGMLRIQALRKKAEAALGDAFDLRGFHDAVLEGGAVPLAILDAQVDAWIASKKGAAPTARR